MAKEFKKIDNCEIQYLVFERVDGKKTIRLIDDTGKSCEFEYLSGENMSFIKWQIEDSIKIFQLNDASILILITTITENL